MKKRVLLTGGSCLLGTELLKIYDKKKYTFFAPSSKQLDITNYKNCKKIISKFNPDIIIHAAAYTDTKKAEIELIKCLDINVCGTINIVKVCNEIKCKIAFISTDYVFDGKKGNYSTEDGINPLSVYSKTKAASELVVRSYFNSLTIRTSFFGYTFPYEKAFIDQWSSKDYIDIVAPKILHACLSDKTGIINCGNIRRSIYEIAVTRNPNVIPINKPKEYVNIPTDTSLEEK
jgi:dTDP-4-dehydrorhamnose reductase